MFAYNHDSLVSQALSCGLVKDLLNILNSRLDNIPNASSCKAQVKHSFSFAHLHCLYIVGSEGLEGNAALFSIWGPGICFKQHFIHNFHRFQIR